MIIAFNNSFRRTSGFTLVELCFVIFISGIILTSLLMVSVAYHQALNQEKMDKTMRYAKDAIETFRLSFDYYPCPANPSLAPSDPNYGISDCSLPAINDVMTGLMPIRTVVGTSSINLADYIDRTEVVVNNFVDVWDRRLLYSVTKSLTDPTTYTPKGGKITIIDEGNINTGGTNSNAHYVILSLGHYNACPSSGLETENCDGDTTFRYALTNDAEGPNHYDDRLTFGVVFKENIWSNHRDSSGTAQGNAHNDNTGNIGIGLTNPTEKIDVQGTISTDTRTMSHTICDDTGAAPCMKPESLYALKCNSTNQYISGITLNPANKQLTPLCSDLIFQPLLQKDCSKLGGIRGFDTSGKVFCNAN